MSLEAAINTPEGDFIRGGFSGNISDAKSQPTKKGGVFFKAKIRDGQHEADLTSFSQTFEHVNGKRVTFSGMGLSRKPNYNGRAQIVIGDKAKWTVGDGDTQPAPPDVPAHSQKTQAYPTPATRTENTGQTVKSGSGATAEEMAKVFAAVSLATQRAYEAAGFDDATCIDAALKAPEWAALWWFGERSVRLDKATKPVQAATEPEEEVPF